METHRKAYTAPVSEIVPAAQDVVTASQFLGEENTPLREDSGGFFKRGRWMFDMREGRWKWYWRHW